MIKRVYKFLLWGIPIGIILWIIGLLIMVRGGGHVTMGNDGKVILGYDEEDSRYLFNEYRDFDLEGPDGPYLIDDQLIIVDVENQIISQERRSDTLTVGIDNQTQDTFDLILQGPHTSPDSEYSHSDKLLAVSDIEGNFEGFVSLLLAQDVIDGSFNWSYGDGALVLVGDFVDRGDKVTEVLWLIYKLDYQAQAAGGSVHFIIGNHELLNLNGQFGYANGKYQRLSQELGASDHVVENNKILYSKRSELGRWMRSKNIMERIGDYIFVHAGIKPDILEYDMSIANLNEYARNHLNEGVVTTQSSYLLDDKVGPLWYRGLVRKKSSNDSELIERLDPVLDRYDAKHIVVGHTVVSDISADLDGRVIRIDLKHGTERESGLTKGLMIEDGVAYKVDDLGNKQKLNLPH